jgi:hypothetical protein
MYISERESGKKLKVEISLMQETDYKGITKARYWFPWKDYKTDCNVYKLTIKGQKDILGLVACREFTAERRTEIALLAASKENVGKMKKYVGVAGCLIAYAAKQAVINYNIEGCISLFPKTLLRQHYIDQYFMEEAGRSLCLEGLSMFKLIKEYQA